VTLCRRDSPLSVSTFDHLLPAVPYRQWVLSFRSSLSVRLGYDAAVASRPSMGCAVGGTCIPVSSPSCRGFAPTPA
jgi:hypothetical protein